MNLLRARHIALLTLALAACGSDEPQSLDPTATYDVFGAAFEPGVAVPAPAVLAEPEAFIGRNVIIEGVAVDECPDPNCLTAIHPRTGGRISVFLAEDGRDAFEVPGEVTGRRIVVNGRLEGAADTTRSSAEASSPGSIRDRGVSSATDSLQRQIGPAFRLHATGIMVEKVRP